VLWAALTLVAAQLGFRAYGVLNGWYRFDDFTFVSRLLSGEMPQVLWQEYGGHLMPGGLALTWMNHRIAPMEWLLPATELIAMQALASVGLVVLLVSSFGRRWGILPPLVLYLASVISVPAALWWAAGVNQLPFQIVLFWGTWAHLKYLRTHRSGWLLTTLVITLAGLVFYEKVITILAVYAFVTLAYFSTGSLKERLVGTWRAHTAAVVAYVVLGVGYLGVYARLALNFDPGAAGGEDTPLAEVSLAMVTRFINGVTLGPWRWTTAGEFTVASPSDLVLALSFVVFGAVLYEIARTTERSLRALWLPGMFLVANSILVATGRAVFVGADIALDYRYQTELPAIAALALALMTLPLRGATEAPRRKEASGFLDSPRSVAAVTAAMAVLGVHSTLGFYSQWHQTAPSETWFRTARAELHQAPNPVPLVDRRVPTFIALALTYPENLVSNMLRMESDHTTFPSAALDRINVITDDGSISPVMVTPVRSGVGQERGCPFPVEDGSATIQLDGPVVGAGFWVRMEYASPTDTPMHIEIGDLAHDLQAPAGMHSVFFEAAGEFDSFVVDGMADDTELCITTVELGLPTPVRGELSE
jgi:hypothetical protein